MLPTVAAERRLSTGCRAGAPVVPYVISIRYSTLSQINQILLQFIYFSLHFSTNLMACMTILLHKFNNCISKFKNSFSNLQICFFFNIVLYFPY